MYLDATAPRGTFTSTRPGGSGLRAPAVPARQGDDTAYHVARKRLPTADLTPIN
jgi:hypothetical protein